MSDVNEKQQIQGAFREVSSKTNFPALEEEILEFWEKQDVFRESIRQREGAPEYVFYDGPPFATGLPHYGHLLAGTIKDIIPRYWTMEGHRVQRRFGWDCHGLPVENEAARDLKRDQDLDLSGKYEIENYGIDKFNEYCRSIVLKYTAEWEKTVKRIGRWVDFENNYRTMDRNFMESVWWVFKALWDKGLVYEGYRVMPYSWKLSTPLSNFEAGENYQTVQDPSVTLRFRVTKSGKIPELKGADILAWTTTPWTLPSNMALAVGEDIDYVLLEARDEEEARDALAKRGVSPGDRLLLAASRRGAYKFLKEEYWHNLKTLKGRELVGLTYAPLFEYFRDKADQGAFRVILSDHVTTENGTGIVHMAPAFGEDDFHACHKEGIPLVDPVDAEGRFTKKVSHFTGRNVKEADKDIIRHLKEAGKLLDQASFSHSYPFCWRSNTPLIYKAISTWFVKVEPFRDAMVKNNEQIHWVPESIGRNRFGNWLANARDWNIARNRYWGTPIPLWRSEEGDTLVIGSLAELEELTGKKFDDIHSHFIDEVEIKKDGQIFRRIPEVFDCWFESGAMPYAQNHYPFENKELVEQNLPADFIAEGLDQTRGWFYTLTVLSTILFERPAFKNVVVNGLILAEDGSKMSKSKKNYPDPREIIDKYGADILRSYMINSPVVRAEPLRFSEDGLVQIYRQVISPLWNAYAFFVTYANLDGYRPAGELTGSEQELDQWLISHFQSLVRNIRENMRYNYLYKVIGEIREFIDLLTNWYIRRSRRRFWKTEASGDKTDAYNTLYYVLSEFTKVVAPFMPFVSETMYRNLVTGLNTEGKMPVSVHLCDYPVAAENLIRPEVERNMDLARQVVELGRGLRSRHDLKIRQPLGHITVVTGGDNRKTLEAYQKIILDELNVKELVFEENESHLVTYSAKANFKVLGKRLGKQMKQAAAAISSLESEAIFEYLETGSIQLGEWQFSGEDIIIDRREKEEQIVQSQGGVTVALNTHLTEELIGEGHARELVNRVQNQRKDAGFEVSDRVEVLLVAPPELVGVAQTHHLYIGGEVLADPEEVHALDATGQGDLKEKDWESVRDWDVNGMPVKILLRRK